MIPSPADETIDHSRFLTWERVIGIAVIAQLLLIVVVAIYFAVVTDAQNHVLANQTISQTKANASIITEIRSDLTVHAHASATRSCGLASMLQYVVETSSTNFRSPEEERNIQGFVDESCLYVPLHGGGNG